jgi:MFS family permease
MTTGLVAAPIVQATRILNSGFATIFIISVLGQYAIYSMNTLTGPFADSLGATPAVVGLVSSLFALTALLFKLVSAPTIDAFRRKWVLLLALGIVLIACLFYASSRSIAELIVARLLTGIALAFLPTVCFVIAADTLPAEHMGKGMGYFAIGTVVTQALAPVVGLRLVAMVGFNETFSIIAALIAATIVFTAWSRLGAALPTRPFSFRPDSIFSGTVIVPAILLLVEAMVWCQVNSFLVLFGETQGVPAQQLGLFFMMLGLALIVSRPLIGHLADRYGSSRVLLSSMCFLALSFLVISCSHSLPMFLASALLAAFGYAGCQPALMAICLRRVPVERRGAASCTAYMGQDIGNLVGGVLGGSLVQFFGYANMWRLMLVPLAAAAVVTMVFRRQLDTPVAVADSVPVRATT